VEQYSFIHLEEQHIDPADLYCSTCTYSEIEVKPLLSTQKMLNILKNQCPNVSCWIPEVSRYCYVRLSTSFRCLRSSSVKLGKIPPPHLLQLWKYSSTTQNPMVRGITLFSKWDTIQ